MPSKSLKDGFTRILGIGKVSDPSWECSCTPQNPVDLDSRTVAEQLLDGGCQRDVGKGRQYGLFTAP